LVAVTVGVGVGVTVADALAVGVGVGVAPAGVGVGVAPTGVGVGEDEPIAAPLLLHADSATAKATSEKKARDIRTDIGTSSKSDGVCARGIGRFATRGPVDYGLTDDLKVR
jgi:hypothetical protein